MPELHKLIHVNKTNFTNISRKSIIYRDNQMYIKIDNPIFETIELICISWFSLEFLLRCWSAPNKNKFFREILNYIDFFSILPYVTSVILSDAYYFKTASFFDASRALQIFRSLRILRIFKLARYSTALKTLGFTFKRSRKELGSLAMIFALGIMLFSSLVYFAEKDQTNTKFTSIPASFW